MEKRERERITKVKEDTHLERLIEKTENIFTKNIERGMMNAYQIRNGHRREINICSYSLIPKLERQHNDNKKSRIKTVGEKTSLHYVLLDCGNHFQQLENTNRKTEKAC